MLVLQLHSLVVVVEDQQPMVEGVVGDQTIPPVEVEAVVVGLEACSGREWQEV